MNDAQHRALAEGSLAIVYFERRAHVVTAEVATGVRTLSPHTFIHIAHAEEPTRSDDAYAGYDVPDDLIW